MEIVTVANVSGFIAVAIVVFQFLLPTFLVLALSNIVGNNHNAVTWSVIGRFVQSSNWPTLLQTDTVATSGVKKSVSAITWVQTIGLLLIAITGVVTPLGLYDGLQTTHLENLTFKYAADAGPFGYATPSRPKLGFNRRCGSIAPVLCPGSEFPFFKNDTIVNDTIQSTSFRMPEGYDGRIPSKRYDYFDSGLNKNSKTVSGIWDIEWRSYNYAQDTTADVPMNNGSKYVIGGFQVFDNTIVNPGLLVVEGLIVDAENGGIGFRNHSLPSIPEGASEWAEDLLFIEPEVVCVPNNLSIDFKLADELSGLERYTDVRLVDNGGFANFDFQNKPRFNGTDAQNNLALYQRASIAAWLNNLALMYYFNVTDFNNGTFNLPFPKEYGFLDSEVGKGIPLRLNDSSDYAFSTDRLRSSTMFSDFLNLPSSEDLGFGYTGIGSFESPNPYDVNSDMFQLISEVCGGYQSYNPGNISAVAVSCGMVYQPSELKEGSRTAQYMIFEPGVEASIKMHSCVSAAKASIKTVNLRLNGTELENLVVTNISTKDYSNEEVPTWGVESTYMKLSDGVPLWGLVDPNMPPVTNVSTLQREYLYLPGYNDNTTTNGFSSVQNMPGIDFYTNALEVMFNIAGSRETSIEFLVTNRPSVMNRLPEYSGVNNAPLFRRWQQAGSTAGGIAKILKLIFTDVAANSVVGTKGLHGKRSKENNLSLRDISSPTDLSGSPKVTIHKHAVLYKWRFAVPAIMTLLMMAIICIVTLVSCIKSPSIIKNVREMLYKTSPGRIMAGLLFPQNGNPAAKTSEWVKRSGTQPIDFAGRVPVRGGPTAVPSSTFLIQEETKDTSYMPVPQKYGFDFSSRHNSRYDVY